MDLTVMLLFVKSCLPTSRSCRTSLSCASSSRGAENGIWRKMQQWKYKYKYKCNHMYKFPAVELRWKYWMIYISVLDKVQQINHKETLSRKKCRKFLKAKTKCVDTFLRFHIIKSQVSRCYLRLIVMSLHKPCYWLTALERLWTVEQILAFSLASCRAHIHGKPLLWRSEIQCTMVLTRRT